MAQSVGKARLIIISALLLVLGFLSTTGFFVVNPIPTVPEGETIWYYRRGTGLPFISSADSLSLKAGRTVSLEDRASINAKIAGIIGGKVISKLGYSRRLYLLSTGNRDFSALGAPRKAVPAPAAPATP